VKPLEFKARIELKEMFSSNETLAQVEHRENLPKISTIDLLGLFILFIACLAFAVLVLLKEVLSKSILHS